MVLKDHELRQIDEAYLERLKTKDPEALLRLSVKLANDLKTARERLNQNPGNSSKPSGSLAPWEKAGQDDDDDPPPDEAPSGKGRGKATSGNTSARGGEDGTPSDAEAGVPRKPGRQPGSPGFGRSQKFEVSSTEPHYPERCAGCHAPLPFDSGIAYTGFDTVDVEFGDTHRPGLHLMVIRHQYFQTACPCCGLENRATPRRDVGDGLWGKTALSEWRLLGPALAALVVYLSLDMRITRRKVKRLLVDLLGLELSVGTIQNCIVESGRALEPVEQHIVEALLNERLLHADETGHNEAGASLWLWVFVTSSAALYLIGRRTQELFDNLLDALETPYRGWLMSDGYGVYRHYANRLRCWAHLIRKAKGLCDSYSPASRQFGQDILESLNGLMKAVYEAREGPGQGTLSIAGDHPITLNYLRLQCETMQHAAHPKTQALAVEFLNDWDAIFRVLEHPSWPLTNNEAERALRHWVILRRITQGTRSEQGSRSLGLIASVIETCRLRATSPLLYIRDVISARRQGEEVLPLPLIPRPAYPT